MPEHKVIIRNGVNTQATPTANSGGWSVSNLIRWKDGFVEKIAGWVKFFASPVADVVRSMHAWSDTDGDHHLVLASKYEVQEYSNSALNDITPYSVLSNPTLNFSTVSGSSIVTIIDNANSGFAVAGGFVVLVVQVAVSNLLLWGTYRITTVVNTSTFKIEAGTLATSTVNNAGAVPVFVSTNLSPVITVTLANYGMIVGDPFYVTVSTAIAGLTLLGHYTVASVIDGSHFTFNAGSNANAGATVSENSNHPRIAYLVGGIDNWNLDNFGQVLIIAPNGRVNGAQSFPGMFAWTPPYVGPLVTPDWGLGNRAAVIALPAPESSTAMIVAMPQAQVISAGSVAYSADTSSRSIDPLLVRWCDAGDYTVWTADATNQAGSNRLSRGSEIIGCRQAPQVTLVWTDLDLWGMQYVGPPFIYSFSIIGSGCGLVAVRAHATLGYSTYWMSQRGFFVYGGQQVTPLACDVWDVIFGDIVLPSDLSFTNKVFAASNSAAGNGGEVMWFYESISGATGEIDSYIKYTPAFNAWDYGKLVRTAWIDQSIYGMPLAVTADLYIMQHETGYDDDTAAMADVSIRSGYQDLADGSQILFIDQIIPDFKWLGSNGYVSLTLYTQNYPGDTPNKIGPFTVTPQNRYVRVRARARQMAIQIDWGESTGFSARLGATRVNAAPSGRRP